HCSSPPVVFPSFPTRRSSDLIGEEWGFLGIILVLGLFATLVLRCLTLARVARDRGGVFLILALAGMLFFSVTVNASMMIGLLPRSEEHTSELQSRVDLVCRIL